jgi:hypothetical protein
MLAHKTAQYILESCDEIQNIEEAFFQATGIRILVFNRTLVSAVPAKGFFLTNHKTWCKQFLHHQVGSL